MDAMAHHRWSVWCGGAWFSVLMAALLIFLTACGGPAAQPATPTIEPTATQAPSPTPQPTATQTALPKLPEGPFTWNGKTRPLLLAHYMPWYQNPKNSGTWGYHWSMNHFNPVQKADGAWTDFASHYTPLVGLYDSRDLAVLDYQVQTMKLSGIDGVIVDWYGMEDFWDYATLNASTGMLFQAIKKTGLKFVICYEDQTVKHMVENGHLKQAEAVPHAQKVMRYMQENWFGDDAYLKVDGHPVLLTFGPQYFNSDDEWKQIFSVLDVQPLFLPLDGKNVAGQAGNYPWPPMWLSKGGVLSHDVLLGYLDEFYSKAKGFQWKYLAGGAFPGFHDIYKEAKVGEGYGYLDALDGKTFRATLQKALDAKPGLIQLITWNDYGEGTNIEPTVEYGYRYLEMVQEARKVTGGGDFSYRAEDLRLPFQLYQLREKYAKDTAVSAQFEKAGQALLAGDLGAAKKILAQYP